MSIDELWLRSGGETGALLLGVPGQQSAFGDPQTWPTLLKTLVPLVLHNPAPMLLWWGPELWQIHNDACLSLDPQLPAVLGVPAARAWGDLWSTLGPIAQRALAGRVSLGSVPVALRAAPGARTKRESLHTFWFSPVFDADAQVVGLLVTVLNATEPLRAALRVEELELRERLLSEREQLLTSERHARAEAEAANLAKDEFLAMLGHELRNPLSPILTALQLMRLRGDESREQAVIERQVGHLVRLVDDLLDVSRITRGKIELRKEPVELGSVVTRAIEIASPLFERRNQRVELAVPETGLLVDADSDRLAQVVANLLTNSSKYSHVGAHIWVSAQALDGRVWLRVRDEGIGIAPDMLHAVFTAFVQHRQSLDRASGGLGLGLAIVQSLVTLHGGHVEARSAGVGKGSEFITDLPLSPSLHRASQPPPAAHKPVVHDAQPPKLVPVLVVDDNEDAADILAETLTRLGYDARVAHDGPSALELIETFQPSVALLDIGLPVMDGYELAQRLLSLPRHKDRLRLIAVTGYGQPTDRQRSEQAGFSAHLVKPVSIEQVLEAVRAVGGGSPPPDAPRSS
jgi:signal transduction histidine kinase/CheY-like chemotaxis protein